MHDMYDTNDMHLSPNPSLSYPEPEPKCTTRTKLQVVLFEGIPGTECTALANSLMNCDVVVVVMVATLTSV